MPATPSTKPPPSRPCETSRGNDIYLSRPPIHRRNPRPFIISAVFFFTTRTGRQIFPSLSEDNRPHATTNHGLPGSPHTRGESKFGTMASVYLQGRRSTGGPITPKSYREALAAQDRATTKNKIYSYTEGQPIQVITSSSQFLISRRL